METVLITGASGRLGKHVAAVFPGSLQPARNDLDITNRDSVLDYVKTHNPDVIIHLAAIAAIRLCEENKRLAWRTNVEGTRNVLDACLRFAEHCYVVYMSTPCVFSGTDAPYTELSLPYPKHFYGVTKLVAETLVLNSALEKKLVIRSNFAPKERWPYPKAFVDRYSTYLFAEDVAEAMKEVIGMRVAGLLHVCGRRRMSMFDLAKMTTPDILPMTMDEYDGPPLTVDMTLETIHPEWGKFEIGSASVVTTTHGTMAS